MTTEEFDALCDKWCQGQNYGIGPEAGKPHPLESHWVSAKCLESLERATRKLLPGSRVAPADGNPRKFMLLTRDNRHGVVFSREPDAPLLSLFRAAQRAAEELSNIKT